MKHSVRVMTFTTACLFGFALHAQQQAENAMKDGASADAQASEAAVGEDAAIRKAIESYVEAFNRGDAQGLAHHWAPSGELTTPEGTTLKGHEQLENAFMEYFADSKNAVLELENTTVEVVSPSVAVESGLARVIVPEQEPSETSYKAIHVKTSDGWRIDSIREQDQPTRPPSHHDQLKDLEWMIGEWADAGDEFTIVTNCRWTTNQNFLVRSFKVLVEDRVDFEGTQVIGWDPANEVIRSWMFDSDGGFGVGRWSGSDGRWTVKSLNVLSDGRRASATNIYEVVDENTIRFSSIGRQVDDELLPNIAPVTVVRNSGQ